MFHVEGWYFKKDTEGKVFIKTPDPSVSIVLTSDTWSSIVASVSAQGGTGEAFHAAFGLHVNRYT